MGSLERHQGLSVAAVLVLALYLGQGACDSICPNGITNITETTGFITYPSSGDYGVNEIKCWMFKVPENYINVAFVFHRKDMEACKSCECDYLQASNNYSFLEFSGKFCGSYSDHHLDHRLHEIGLPLAGVVSGSTLYVRFVSDDTVHLKGFSANIIPGSDSGGIKNFMYAWDGVTTEFGTPKYGIKNYPDNYHQQWFLIVPKGRQVQLEFESFELEESIGCKKDYVEIREAYFVYTLHDPHSVTGEYGPILTGHLCGNAKPSAVHSKGNMVWVNFISDNTTTVYKGFKASFTAGQGRRLSVSNPWSLWVLSTLLLIASKSGVL